MESLVELCFQWNSSFRYRAASSPVCNLFRNIKERLLTMKDDTKQVIFLWVVSIVLAWVIFAIVSSEREIRKYKIECLRFYSERECRSFLSNGHSPLGEPTNGRE